MTDTLKNWLSHLSGLLAVLALLFYPLSLGPMCWLYENGHLDSLSDSQTELLETVYLPIAWLAENTAFETPIYWYVFLWIDD